MLSERIDQWEQEKIQQGRVEGRVEGQLETYRELALELVKRKFPELSDKYVAKLKNVSLDEAKAIYAEVMSNNTEIELAM